MATRKSIASKNDANHRKMAAPVSGGVEPIALDRIPDVCFTTSPGLYTITPGAKKIDAIDQLTARLSQLSALLVITTGDGDEPFNQWANPIRHNYLWCCSMLAKECQQLALLVALCNHEDADIKGAAHG